MHLIVDGALSGTGIRNGAEGGYIEPAEIGLSADLCESLLAWQKAYENAHFHQFEDMMKNRELDSRGIDLARTVQRQKPHEVVSYFSSALMKEIPL